MGKIQLKGKKFGRWTVILKSDTSEIKWLCKCSCGISKEIRYQSLLYGISKSCGCLRKELASINNKTHGDSKTRLYSIWFGIKKRIYNIKNKEYHNYGGRGIKICKEWLKYENFREWALNNGYTDMLTIERVNYNGNYCPKNCTWIPMNQQGLNRRGLVLNKGETQKGAGLRLGGSPTLVRDRMKKLKWSKNKAYNTPANIKNNENFNPHKYEND